MQRHRFTNAVAALEPSLTASGFTSAAFVPLPIGFLVPANYHVQVAEIYRVAAECTREQLAPRSRFNSLQFSVN